MVKYVRVMASEDKKPESRSKSAEVITIVGLGFIGGSVGLALREQGRQRQIIGHDREPSQTRRARRLGAIDHAEWNLIRACERADMVVLALPASEIRSTLEVIATDLKPGCLVTDTATVKGMVLSWAEELVPPQVNFVGGDPIIQTPGSGLDGARPDLFKDQVYCLTPATNSSPTAVQQTTEFVQLLGAKPYFIDATEHDGLRAAVEHLPMLFFRLLLREVARSPSSQEMRQLQGRLLTQAESLLKEEVTLYRSHCLMNSGAISHWARQMRLRLKELEQLIEARDEEGLTILFDEVIGSRELKPEAEQQTPLWHQWLGVGRHGRKEK